jgi:hypothetical protein
VRLDKAIVFFNAFSHFILSILYSILYMESILYSMLHLFFYMHFFILYCIFPCYMSYHKTFCIPWEPGDELLRRLEER